MVKNPDAGVLWESLDHFTSKGRCIGRVYQSAFGKVEILLHLNVKLLSTGSAMSRKNQLVWKPVELLEGFAPAAEMTLAEKRMDAVVYQILNYYRLGIGKSDHHGLLGTPFTAKGPGANTPASGHLILQR